MIMYRLSQAGHSVTVYERNNRCGGLLQYGIPTMKLSKDVNTSPPTDLTHLEIFCTFFAFCIGRLYSDA